MRILFIAGDAFPTRCIVALAESDSHAALSEWSAHPSHARHSSERFDECESGNGGAEKERSCHITGSVKTVNTVRGCCWDERGLEINIAQLRLGTGT